MGGCMEAQPQARLRCRPLPAARSPSHGMSRPASPGLFSEPRSGESRRDSDCPRGRRGLQSRYGQNALVHITVSDAQGRKVIMTTAPMNDAGGFIYQFEVPPQAAPGEASVEATPTGSTGVTTQAGTTASPIRRAWPEPHAQPGPHP